MPWAPHVHQPCAIRQGAEGIRATAVLSPLTAAAYPGDGGPRREQNILNEIRALTSLLRARTDASDDDAPQPADQDGCVLSLTRHSSPSGLQHGCMRPADSHTMRMVPAVPHVQACKPELVCVTAGYFQTSMV